MGFLLNHLIAESVRAESGERLSNSDPITGQAAWYDLRVRIRKAEESGVWPKLEFGTMMFNRRAGIARQLIFARRAMPALPVWFATCA